MIPESVMTFKPGPPPKKSPCKAALQAAAAVSEEIKEEKNKLPWKGHRFGHQAQAPPSRAGYPKPPFMQGQIGNIIYTNKPAQTLEDMPNGCSLVIRSWQKAILELEQRGKYILTDAFGNLWYSPSAFDEWRAGVDSGSFPELDLEVTCLAIICEGPHFSLATSKCKQSFCDVLHPLPSIDDSPFPLDTDRNFSHDPIVEPNNE